MSKADTQRGGVILRAFLANLGIAVAKFAGAVITGSSSMVTEGVHSLVDTINELLLFHGQKRANKPADAVHPLGYAREQYFWAFVVGLLVFTLGAGVALYQGLGNLADPAETRTPVVALAILGIALLLEGWSLRAAAQEFNRMRGDMKVIEAIRTSRDTVTLSVLLEDSAAVVGLLLAAGGIALELLTGNPRWNAIASILIAVALAAVAVVLLIKAKHLLIGQRSDPALMIKVRSIVEAEPGLTSINELLAIQQSAETSIALISLDFDDTLSARQIETAVARIKAKVATEIPMFGRIYVAVERNPALSQADQGRPTLE